MPIKQNGSRLGAGWMLRSLWGLILGARRREGDDARLCSLTRIKVLVTRVLMPGATRLCISRHSHTTQSICSPTIRLLPPEPNTEYARPTRNSVLAIQRLLVLLAADSETPFDANSAVPLPSLPIHKPHGRYMLRCPPSPQTIYHSVSSVCTCARRVQSNGS